MKACNLCSYNLASWYMSWRSAHTCTQRSKYKDGNAGVVWNSKSLDIIKDLSVGDQGHE